MKYVSFIMLCLWSIYPIAAMNSFSNTAQLLVVFKILKNGKPKSPTNPLIKIHLSEGISLSAALLELAKTVHKIDGTKLQPMFGFEARKIDGESLNTTKIIKGPVGNIVLNTLNFIDAGISEENPIYAYPQQ